MPTGTVKWFNNSKGYGFIEPQDGGEDVFVHYSAVQGSGFRTLVQGQMVNYEVERGPKGLQARDVEAQGEAPQGEAPQSEAPQSEASQGEASQSETPQD